jgi:hypothetical protein
MGQGFGCFLDLREKVFLMKGLEAVLPPTGQGFKVNASLQFFYSAVDNIIISKSASMISLKS